MKHTRIFAWTLCAMLLTGCPAGQPAVPPEEAKDEAAGPLEPFSPDALSQELYAALEREWDSWDALSQEAKMVSSHLPGWCDRDFENWAEGEAFLGLAVPNPLEEAAWLERGTYVAMPLGFRDAPRVKTAWYGIEDGHVEWVSLQAGYRDGEVRVMIDATLYGDPAEGKSADRSWSTEMERQAYLEEFPEAPVQVISDSGERYVSSMARLAQDGVLYHLNVVGESGETEAVEETLERVLDSFGISLKNCTA